MPCPSASGQPAGIKMVFDVAIASSSSKARVKCGRVGLLRLAAEDAWRRVEEGLALDSASMINTSLTFSSIHSLRISFPASTWEYRHDPRLQVLSRTPHPHPPQPPSNLLPNMIHSIFWSCLKPFPKKQGYSHFLRLMMRARSGSSSALRRVYSNLRESPHHNQTIEAYFSLQQRALFSRGPVKRSKKMQ